MRPPRKAIDQHDAPATITIDKGDATDTAAIERYDAKLCVRYLFSNGREKAAFERQCIAPGSTFALDAREGAFVLLDHLQIMKLAVSLGGTETLISHPASMTHSGVARKLCEEIALTDALIRISRK